MYWRAQQTWYLKQNSEKVLLLTAISLFLLRKENYLNLQDLTIFLGNPYILFFMAAAARRVFFLCAPKEISSMGRFPELIQSFSQPWFALERSFFFQPGTLHFPDTMLIARNGAVQRKYVPIGTFCISSDVDYEAFGRICHSQQMQLGKERSRLAWHFVVLLNI